MSEEKGQGVLRARLTEPEPGLFKAEFLDPDIEDLPNTVSVTDRHIGMDRDGVRAWTEERAEEMGYRIQWE